MGCEGLAYTWFFVLAQTRAAHTIDVFVESLGSKTLFAKIVWTLHGPLRHSYG
jgi:hypothetical protein